MCFCPVPSRHLPAHPPRLPSPLAGRRGHSLGGLSLRAVGHAGATLPPSGAPPGGRRPVHPETRAAPRRAPSLSSLRQSRGAVRGSQAGRPRRVNSLGQGGEEEIALEIAQRLGLPAAWLARGTSPVHRFGDLDPARSREMDRMPFLCQGSSGGWSAHKAKCGTSCQTEAEACSLHLRASEKMQSRAMFYVIPAKKEKKRKKKK